MNRLLVAAVSIAMSSYALAANAQPAKPAPITAKANLSAPPQVVKAIESAYNARFGSKPSEVNTTPIPGIYQVIMAGSISYMDGTGRYVLEGTVIDTKTNTSLSEAKHNEMAKKAVASFNLNDAIKIQHGAGTNIIYTFEDANCGFCKKLAPELDKLTDVTIYTFPLMFLGPDSGEKAKRAWCSPNKAETWTKFLTNAEVTATDTICDTSFLERNGAMARSLGVTGTPTLVFKDGSRIVGYREGGDIEKHLLTVK